SLRNLKWLGLVRWLGALVSAVVAGGLIVIAPLPINLVILVAWIYWLRRSTRRLRGKELEKSPGLDEEFGRGPAAAPHGLTFGRTIIALQVVIVGAIIAVAHSLPIKDIDRCMNLAVSLPKTTMTLGEFAELRHERVHPLHLSPEPGEESIVLQFPRKK